MPLIPFLDRYYRRENNIGVGLGKEKNSKYSDIEKQLRGTRLKNVTLYICAVRLMIIKARGQKRAKALRREKRF